MSQQLTPPSDPTTLCHSAELDQPYIKLIWVETPPEDAVWKGVTVAAA